MSRPIQALLVLSFVAGMLLLLQPFLARLALLGCMLLFAGYVLVLLVGALMGVVRGRLPEWVWSGVRLGAFLLTAMLLLCGPAIGWVKYNEFSARSYVARAVAHMDEVRRHTGRFPVVLPTDQLGRNRSFERLRGQFSSDGEVYRFRYQSPIGMPGGGEFRSGRREWVRPDDE